MSAKLFAIKDTKIGFGAPFKAPNNFAAIRMFADTVNSPETMMNQHAEDFQLFAVGEMDEDTGEITTEVKFLENAVNVKA